MKNIFKLVALALLTASGVSGGAVPVNATTSSKMSAQIKKSLDDSLDSFESFESMESENTTTVLPSIEDQFLDATTTESDEYIISFNPALLPQHKLRGRRLETLGTAVSEVTDEQSGNTTVTRKITKEEYAALDPIVKDQIVVGTNNMFSMQDEAFDMLSSSLASSMTMQAKSAPSTKKQKAKPKAENKAKPTISEEMLPQGLSDSVSGDGKFVVDVAPNTVKSDVCIFILDGQVNPMPSEFGTRLDKGFNAVYWENAPGVDDAKCFHGSHVASTAAGNTSGFARNARVYPVRVLDNNCNGTPEGLVAGIDHAIQMYQTSIQQGKKMLPIMNLSLDAMQNDVIDAAVARAEAAGFIVVQCAGNHNKDASLASPAAAARFSPNIITVGSVMQSTAKARYSNYGNLVSVYAFGSTVSAAVEEDINGIVKIMVMSGTSMTAPQVAGILGNIWEKNPTWDRSQVVQEFYKKTRALQHPIAKELDISPDFEPKRIARQQQVPLEEVVLKTTKTGFRIPTQTEFAPLKIGQSLRLEFHIANVQKGNVFRFGLFSDPISSLTQPNDPEIMPTVGSATVNIPKLTEPGKYIVQITRQADVAGKSTYWLEISGNGLNFPAKLRLDNDKRPFQYWGVSSTKPGIGIKGLKQQLIDAKKKGRQTAEIMQDEAEDTESETTGTKADKGIKRS